jgi:hypothetical protein
MQPSHLLKIDSLDDGWCDKDQVLLHACFRLLSDFVEKEMMVQDYPDWNQRKKQKMPERIFKNCTPGGRKGRKKKRTKNLLPLKKIRMSM